MPVKSVDIQKFRRSCWDCTSGGGVKLDMAVTACLAGWRGVLEGTDAALNPLRGMPMDLDA